MSNHLPSAPRQLRAAIIGLGFDGQGGTHRIITGKDCLVVGGDEDTHGEMLETMLRLETELERLGRRLGDLPPADLAEVAWRIDSPELHALAMNMESGLRRSGRTFAETSPEELNAMAAGSQP